MRPTLFAQGNKRTLSKLESLRRQAHLDKASRVAFRIQAITLSIEKYSASQIARVLGVHRDSVNSWINAWNNYREEGLWEGYRSGRPPKLSGAQREHLYDLIESGPVAYGFQSGVWTSPIVAGVIEEEFGVAYHAGHVRKLLKELGFSLQRPTTKLVQADAKKQHRWIRYTYPNLKKKPKKSGR